MMTSTIMMDPHIASNSARVLSTPAPVPGGGGIALDQPAMDLLAVAKHGWGRLGATPPAH
jgi:hypothetical protein